MPLNVWMAWRAPASTAAIAWSYVASVWASAATAPSAATPADDVERARQLGRERDHPQRAGGGQRLELGRVRGAQRGAVLRAAPLLAQPRALEVGAEDQRVLGGGDAGDRAGQHAGRRGHGGGEQGRGAVRGVEARGARALLGVAAHEVRAPAAVDVEVDEAGHDEVAAEVPRLGGRRRPPSPRPRRGRR